MVFTWKPVYLVYDELLYKELALDILHLKPLQSYMYPPLYSLMISPGFMMGDYFYEGILACNILGKAVGLYIIYCLLIRISDEHTSALALCMIGFSPIYFIYSRYILAENLFAPILIITILYYIIYRDEVLACGGGKEKSLPDMWSDSSCNRIILDKVSCNSIISCVLYLLVRNFQKATERNEKGIAAGNYFYILCDFVIYKLWVPVCKDS